MTDEYARGKIDGYRSALETFGTSLIAALRENERNCTELAASLRISREALEKWIAHAKSSPPLSAEER